MRHLFSVVSPSIVSVRFLLRKGIMLRGSFKPSTGYICCESKTISLVAMSNLSLLADFFRQRGVLIILHLAILACSIMLIVMISIDTFNNVPFYSQPKFQHRQFWICVFFVADFFIEFFLSKKKWHYFYTHFIFLLVSIPYQMIIFHYNIPVSRELAYLVRYIPLIRGGYAMSVVVSWFTSNKATGLFFSYIIILISMVYFASLTFYLFEHKANPLVKDYTDALWWAAMDVTTVGSNIVAVTGVGRVLSVLLAALGMMMFPIFTVYVTNIITNYNKQATGNPIISAYREYKKNHPATDSSQTPSPDDGNKLNPPTH